MLKKTSLLLSALSLAALSGCVNTAPGNSTYYGQYYDAFGNSCSSIPYPGCDYDFNGLKIMVYQDPYYGLSNYTTGWGYYDYATDSYDSYWYSPNGIIYDAYGYALNSQSQDDQGRDLISDVAEAEETGIQKTAEQFAAKYSLATDRAVEIVRTLRDWEVFGSKRARTEQDFAEFTKRLYGVDLSAAKDALTQAQKGDLSGVEQLNKQVAQYWGTDPETSRQILKSWYGEQAAQYGIR
jgi:hypothetical protein